MRAIPAFEESDAAKGLDVMFVLMFTAEALVKICAQGFALGHPSCYIRSHWNKLDFFVVLSGLAELVGLGEGFPWIVVVPTQKGNLL